MKYDEITFIDALNGTWSYQYDGAARAVVALLLGAQDMAGELFFTRQAGEIPFEMVAARFAGLAEALTRVLGAPIGSLSLIDDATLRLWFS